jgi:hypothetical protein
MITRKLGKFLRGGATPFQIFSATLLGGLIGAHPGIGQGPLLYLLLVFLLIILNANLFLAAIVLLITRLLYLLLLPVLFNIGVALLESPFGSVVATLVNAPVTAWFGLETYVMVPALVLGLLSGGLFGIAINRTLRGFRKKMAQLETSSERYQDLSERFWLKALAWIFFGGLKGKKSWEELSEGSKGLPVRPLGIILVIALVILGIIGFKFLEPTLVTSVVREQLELANGATVDIEAIEIKAAENRLTLRGLAMADPEQLTTNRFAAEEITADVSGMSLLAKKVVLDSLFIGQPSTGGERRLVGRRIEKTVEETPEETEDPEVYSIEGILSKSGVWRERLELVKRIYDRLAPVLKSDKEAEAEEELSWKERLAERAREEGYARVKADSLLKGSPRLMIRKLEGDTLEVKGEAARFAYSGASLSSQPALSADPGLLSLSRNDEKLRLSLRLPSAETPSRSEIEFFYGGLTVEEIETAAGRDLPMSGGTVDISGKGVIDNGVLNVPLELVFRNSTLSAFGSSLPLDGVPIQIQLEGSVGSPRLRIPTDAFENAVKSGGKQQIENLIEEAAGDKLKGLLPFGKGD